MRQSLLIADADVELCDLYGRFLTELGYEVATSSDGLDCLQKLRQVTPAALVLDLDLRGEEVRASWPGCAGRVS